MKLLVWQKTADLVKEAIQSILYALTKVKIFHSDRGKEFDNTLIDDMLEAFGITRSLSQAGCPYDNAVAESTYRSFKLEFSNKETFYSDRGKEFDNQLIDELLEAFCITRSLSQAGCPYENTVAESIYRSYKLEFSNQETFQSL